MKMLKVKEVRHDWTAKRNTSSEGDLWGGSFYLGIKRWGLGPARGPTPTPAALWDGSEPLSAGRPGSAQVPGKRESEWWCQCVCPRRSAATQLRLSAHRLLNSVRLRSPAPVLSPQGARLQQPGRSATRTVHAPAAVLEPHASHKPPATARVRAGTLRTPAGSATAGSATASPPSLSHALP